MAEKPKHNPWNAMGNYARGILFTVIEILAALSLGGWLSVGLWFIASWNVLILALTTFGLASKAAEALNAEAAR